MESTSSGDAEIEEVSPSWSKSWSKLLIERERYIIIGGQFWPMRQTVSNGNSFIVWCNACNINSEVWGSTSLPGLDTLVLQKMLVYWRIILRDHEASVIHPIFQTIIAYLPYIWNSIFYFCTWWTFFLTCHAIRGSECEVSFGISSMNSITLSMPMITKESDPISRCRSTYGIYILILISVVISIPLLAQWWLPAICWWFGSMEELVHVRLPMHPLI